MVINSDCCRGTGILPTFNAPQWIAQTIIFVLILGFPVAMIPKLMGKALSIVTRCITTHLIHKAGFTHATARTGAVTFIQRFGSALNLNVHFHSLFLDGVYITGFDQNKQVFRRVNAPTQQELQALVHTLSERLP